MISNIGAKKLPVSLLSLSFTSEQLENEFLDLLRKSSVKLVRVALILAVALYMIFALLDDYFLPASAEKILFIRIAVSCIFLIALGMTFNEIIYKYFQLILFTLVIIASSGIIWMILISESSAGSSYYAGLLLVILYAHSILRLRFIYATISTWCVIVIYLILSDTLIITPATTIYNNSFFLIGANILGMFSSYSIEYYMRRVFWQTKPIQEKRMQLEEEHERKAKELEAVR